MRSCQNLARLVAVFLIPAIVLPGCKSTQPNQEAAQPAGSTTAPASTTPPQAATTPASTAPTQVATTPASTNPAAPAPISIDDLVAPIALYPDQLLSQVLVTATNPQEVLDLGNWLIQNQNLTGDAAVTAAKNAGFSPSAQYLAAFPQVVDNMCQQMDWTTQLGEAFKTDQKGVMDAIQRKRAQAQQMGNLQSGPQLTVASSTNNGQNVVQITPTNPQTVYVPQYNPVTVYTSPAPTTTTVVQQSGVSTGTAIGIGLLSFGVGMALGSMINRNNYYPYPSWGYGGMYYGGRPYYPPPYRPPVYPGYRPVYGYRPPPNYHWNQYNRQVNVRVNNSSYYNRINTNGYHGNPNNNYQGARNNVPAKNGNYRGQSTYQGARPQTPSQRPGSSMANANPNLKAPPQGGVNRRPTASTPNRANGGQQTQPPNRNNARPPQGANNAAARNNAAAKSTRPATSNTSSNRPANPPQNANRNRPSPSSTPQAQHRGNSSATARPASSKPNKPAGNANKPKPGGNQRQVKGPS